MKKKMGAVLLVIIISLALGLPAPQAALAAGNIIYVDDDATGANDGTSWDNAYTDLQSALASAEAGEEIWVAEGTYWPTSAEQPSEEDRSVSFELDSGEKVYGGFEGIETSREERDWEDHETILSGDIGSPVWPYDNSYHVVMGQGMNEAILDGFTITGGAAYDSGQDTPNNWGAGIYNNGTLTVNNCDISDNWANWRGGGIYNSGTLTVNNCIIEENSASRRGGGGIYNNGELTVNNCIFSNNSSAGKGGGVYNDEGTLTVNDSTISYNKATWAGGGIYNSGELTVNHCVISYNSGYLAYQPYDGGGIYSNGELTVNNSTFSNNSAGYNGGGLAAHGGGNAMLNNNIFTSNKTKASLTNRGGGGISLVNAKLALINSIVNGNESAAEGGGIRAGGVCELTIINSTIVNNTATSYGGGIRLGQTNIITNSILWGNDASEGDQVYQPSGVQTNTVTYSVVEGEYNGGAYPGDGNINQDPQFVSAYDNLRLQASSPAIDVGNNKAVPAGITVDLDGNPRIVNRTVDMGAFEYLTALQVATRDLIEQVGDLVDSEVLNPGQGNSLIVKLEAAFDKMYRNNKTAINQLEAFIKQVEDFIGKGILSDEDGPPLIQAANGIINMIKQL